MSLNNVKLNTDCIVKSIDLKNKKTQIRLMELGLIEGSLVRVNKKSAFAPYLLHRLF